MTKVHKVAGLRISRVASIDSGDDRLPDLAPPEERLRREKNRIFSSDSINLSHDASIQDVFHPDTLDEHPDFVSRATVYVMTSIVFVFAMPVGMALLLLNILGGENMRTTAHVMALTGLFLALSAAGADSLLQL